MIKGWKKSQRSSGYYKKQKGKLPEFLKFEFMDINYSKRWRVYYKRGINDSSQKDLGYFKTKAQALAYAKSYMRKH